MVTGELSSTGDRSRFHLHRGLGLVTDIFTPDDIASLPGTSAIGHTRYSTAGGKTQLEGFQPFCVRYRIGNLALAHNGNLSNFHELRSFFEQHGVLLQSTVDSELFLHLISHSKRRSQLDQIFDAMTQAEGAFSCVIMTETSLVAVRDPNGFRPLCIGRIPKGGPDGGDGYVVASETCALDLCKAEYVREVEPGELIVIDRNTVNTGAFTTLRLPQKFGVSQCIFEYVYFARPDSLIFGDFVTKVRREHGRQLAREHPVPKVGPDSPPVVVVPVPDSAAHATMGYVEECLRMGLSCIQDLGFFRNPYVGRSFIAPSQENRDIKVRCKFNPMRHVCEGQIIVMIDDSIVRGTTAKQLIRLVMAAGAKEVHFRVASPPVTDPCFYGMDFPTKEELFANVHAGDKTAMAKWLGVESIGYLSPEGLVESTVRSSPTGASHGYCRACFTGIYPVPVTSQAAQVLSEEKGPHPENLFTKR
uniref:Amidophosphoribosyltransferase n=1 Tax=Hemiselmis andersenii TaxID=464988 RepID=A0A6T8N1J5_HEMAN